jgi:hypothetical protein
MHLVDLLRRPEGKTLEFKRDLSAPDGALRTIVAFANTSGGTLLVGKAGCDQTFLVCPLRPPWLKGRWARGLPLCAEISTFCPFSCTSQQVDT